MRGTLEHGRFGWNAVPKIPLAARARERRHQAAAEDHPAMMGSCRRRVPLSGTSALTQLGQADPPPEPVTVPELDPEPEPPPGGGAGRLMQLGAGGEVTIEPP